MRGDRGGARDLLDYFGSNCFAGSAPGSITVDDHKAPLFFGFLELLYAIVGKDVSGGFSCGYKE